MTREGGRWGEGGGYTGGLKVTAWPSNGGEGERAIDKEWRRPGPSP